MVFSSTVHSSAGTVYPAAAQRGTVLVFQCRADGLEGWKGEEPGVRDGLVSLQSPPPVSNDSAEILAHEHIGTLEITVEDAAAVRILQAIHHLEEHTQLQH